jgi:hypothetical protein
VPATILAEGPAVCSFCDRPRSTKAEADVCVVGAGIAGGNTDSHVDKPLPWILHLI